MSKRFPWGRVIEVFHYDFEGKVLEVVKYHPWIYKDCASTNKADESKVSYSCEEMSTSSGSLFEAVIRWMAYKQLGCNESLLASGICRALEIGDEKQ